MSISDVMNINLQIHDTLLCVFTNQTQMLMLRSVGKWICSKSNSAQLSGVHAKKSGTVSAAADAAGVGGAGPMEEEAAGARPAAAAREGTRRRQRRRCRLALNTGESSEVASPSLTFRPREERALRYVLHHLFCRPPHPTSQPISKLISSNNSV